MKKEFNQNYVSIPILLIAVTILSLKGNTSYDEQLTVAGIILFTIFWGFMIFFNRDSKRKVLLAIAGYVVLMGTYFLNR